MTTLTLFLVLYDEINKLDFTDVRDQHVRKKLMNIKEMTLCLMADGETKPMTSRLEREISGLHLQLRQKNLTPKKIPRFEIIFALFTLGRAHSAPRQRKRITFNPNPKPNA